MPTVLQFLFIALGVFALGLFLILWFLRLDIALRLLGLLLRSGLERREHDYHALPFKHRHHLDFAIFLKVVGETEEKHLSLLLKQDGASAEKHIGFHFRSFFQESYGMLQLEVVVMIVSLRTETNLLYYNLSGFLLLLLLPFLLLIEEFLIVEKPISRGLS